MPSISAEINTFGMSHPNAAVVDIRDGVDVDRPGQEVIP
jgi:hypothetical protein